MNLKDIMLSETGQTQNEKYDPTYMCNKPVELLELGIRMVQGLGVGGREKCWSKCTTCSYKMGKFCGSNV